MRPSVLPVNDALGDDENLWMTSQQSIFSVLTETTEFEKCFEVLYRSLSEQALVR